MKNEMETREEEEQKNEELLVNLLETKQYTKFRQTCADMQAADIAAVMDDLEDEDSLKMFRILPKSMAADVFAQLEIDDQQYIIRSLSDKESANIIDNLMADDATDLLEEMPANVVKKILANARPDTRADINHLLRYPEDSAGSVMTVEFVDLRENMTVADAINRIRDIGIDSETVNILYVLDKERVLVGTVADGEKRMVGIITIDDVVDIMEEEATEDIEKMAAIVPSDKTYFKTSIFETYKHRMPWLLLLMISATFTGAIITSYEKALASYVVLTAYIPMLMDTGGNAGSQASVSIIRALSLDEVEFRELPKAIWKELRVAVMCGITLAAVNFVKLLIVDRIPMEIAAIVCLTLVVVVIFAKFIGCCLPLLADRIHLDPAVMASPLITTIVDAVSLLTYFQIATRILHL